MKEIKGNLFDQKVDAICIPTNYHVRTDGRSTMGKGVALQAKIRWPGIDCLLGKIIREYNKSKERGTFVHYSNEIILDKGFKIVGYPISTPPDYDVVSFMVKPQKGFCNIDKSNVISYAKDDYKAGDQVLSYHLKASIDEIKNSARELLFFADIYRWKTIALPRVGCRAGELKWEDVSIALNEILDNRFIIVS